MDSVYSAATSTTHGRTGTQKEDVVEDTLEDVPEELMKKKPRKGNHAKPKIAGKK